MQIKELSKNFGNLKAVDKLSLSVYESQLLCLLGHNGAGKTTTISLVTGLIEKDEGIVQFYGKSIDTDLDQIRSMTGICVQRDVLYDDLTVEEHLIYYARMKGFEGQDLQQELEYIIQKCVLTTERYKLSKQLSGGNKRKLSLGMALIGKSKVVFLDEPTSGMDPVTRRAIWDILQNVKQENRTLILTTHHLDEAEELSERIAIMAKGRLLTVGSASFIKKNFGVGYHLSILKQRDTQLSIQSWKDKKEQIMEIVQKYISQAQYNPQTAEDVLVFMIPFEHKQNLVPLFKILENDNTISIAMNMNSLEEAFINIGMDEDNFINRTRRYTDPNYAVQANSNNNDLPEQYTDFSQIRVPSCLSKRPSYQFHLQLKASLMRKIYSTKFGKKFILQIIVPLYFVIVTAVICKIQKNQQHNMESKDLIALYAFLSTFELAFGMSISAGGIAGQPVEEREKKLKYALNVMGCRIYPYWVGTMIYDTLVAEISIIILIILFFSLQFIVLIKILFRGITEMTDIGKCMIYMFAQFAFVGISYAVSWLYRSASLAYKTTFLVMYALFFFLPLILMLAIQNKIMWYLTAFLSPIICMFQGLLIGSNFEVGISNYSILFIFILICQGVLGFLLCIFIDTRSLRAQQNQNVQLVQSNEIDVIQEAERVQLCQDTVKALNISKMYSNGFMAVKGTSFGINEKQVFGLLGPNGAGKSTTFNMLTSKIKPSTGKILLQNQHAEKGNAELYQNVGICPQFDCLWDQMTPLEHLKIFALIKGLSGDEVDEAVNYFIRIMQLDSYVKTNADKLSGGNKRKVCVAMALIGGPNMQFFDEPSSGVDPIARRFLWNTIQQGLRLNNSAVILTTHSMDEAESLCHKIGIQINGQFVCMGSPQHLKAKYGSGYQISVDVIQDEEKISNLILNKFPNCQLLIKKENSNHLMFQFPNKEFSFYQVFDYLQNELQNKMAVISDFQIHQSSLEQVYNQFDYILIYKVFMYFASFQANRENEVFIPQPKRCFAMCMGDEEE